MRSARPTIKRRSSGLTSRPTAAPTAKVVVSAPTAPTQPVAQTGHAPLPYSTYPEITLSASLAHELAVARRRQARHGLLGSLSRQLLRYIGLRRAHSSDTLAGGPLRQGDVLRDLPYFTQASEISFFSTHPSLCDDIFTVGHGDRLHFGAGLWSGRDATVIGTRGGQLWVVLDGESIARQLPVPESHVTVPGTEAVAGRRSGRVDREGGESVWSRLQAYYQVRLIQGGPDGVESSAAAPPDASVNTTLGGESTASTAAQTLESGLSARVLARVDDATRRVYSAEQRAFLQRAPDLFVSVVAEQDGDGGGVHSLSPFLPSPRDSSGDPSYRSPFQSTPTRLSGGAPAGSEGGSPLSEGSADVAFAEAAGDALSAPLPLVVPGAEHATSLYAMVTEDGEATAGKVVLLAPRILAVSGTAGWAGEGTVVTEAGGIRHFKASLSASLVHS